MIELLATSPRRVPGGSRRPRRGYALALTIGSLLIVVAMAGALVAAARDRHLHLVAEERQVQADALATSGLSCAAARLRAAAEYAGETWDIDSQAFGGKEAGRVTIRIEPVGDAPRERKIVVTAEFPATGDRVVRRDREVTVKLAQ